MGRGDRPGDAHAQGDIPAGSIAWCSAPTARDSPQAVRIRRWKVWDLATGQETLTLKGHTAKVWSVAFSPDGSRLASASLDNTVKVWDAATGQERLTLKGHTSWVLGVAFSPDGKRLASGGWDQTVKLWDAVTGKETLTLRGHTGGVGAWRSAPTAHASPPPVGTTR